MDEVGQAQPLQIVKNKGGRPKGSKEGRESKSRRIDRTVLELRAKNVPVPAIAASVGLSVPAVEVRISKLRNILQSMDKLDDWEKQKANLLSAAQHELLKSMLREDKLEKASVNNLAYALTQVHTATRLERNQATANTQTVVRYTTLPDLPDTTPTELPVIPDPVPDKG